MKEYTVYFEPVMLKADNKEEAVKLAKKHIKKHLSIEYVREEKF